MTGIPVLKVDGKEITTGREKAEALSEHYDSIFTNEDLTDIPCLLTPPAPRIKELALDVNGIQKLLKKLDPKKANGPDQISTYILKECAEEIAPILTNMFTTSLATGTTPSLWRTANIVAIFKKGSKMSTENYRPVSLTSVVCKVLEHIIHRHIMNHCDQHNLLRSHQHGFRQNHSCESQLILSMEDIYRQHDKNKQVDMLILDFTKAFDTVPHQRLLMKLKHYGIDSNLHRWISSWLTERTQQVVVDGDYSSCKQVRSGVPQGTVLGPLMFLLYINDIGDHLNHSTIRLFADDCLLYRTISNQDDADRLQDDLDKLQEWTETWQMNFNAKKCYLLSTHSKRDPALNRYRLNGEEIAKTSHHSYLGVELQDDGKWTKHIENCTKKANRALGFIRRNFGRCPESIKESLYTAMVRPHLEYASGAWSPHLKKDINRLDNIQRKASRFVKSCNSRDPGTVTGLLADLGWNSLKQRRTKHDLTLFYQAVNGHIEIPLPPYVIPVKRNNKSHHEKGYIQMFAKNDQYKNTRIQPLHIIQKRAIRICKKADYMSHSRPLFYQLKSLNIHDMVNFKCMVFMYRVYNKLPPANIMSYFKKINACHNHNVRMKNCNFKIKFSRTNKKSECISVKGPKMWNDLPADIKLCKSMFTFKKMYKALLLQPYQFG